jgi:hypothetical protein
MDQIPEIVTNWYQHLTRLVCGQESQDITKIFQTKTTTWEYNSSLCQKHLEFFSICLSKFYANFTSSNQFLLDKGIGLVVFGTDCNRRIKWTLTQWNHKFYYKLGLPLCRCTFSSTALQQKCFWRLWFPVDVYHLESTNCSHFWWQHT